MKIGTQRRWDIAKIDDIDKLREIVAESFGKFDFLFVNAGVANFEPFEKVTEKEYDRIFNINTKGAFFSVQRLSPLIKNGGAIVFTTFLMSRYTNCSE